MSELIKYIDQLADMTSRSQAGKYHKWLKYEGKLFTNISTNHIINNVNPRIKRCYDNCSKAVIRNSNLRYYEGYVLTSLGIPIEHAFLLNEKNEVVDPTLSLIDHIGIEYYGVNIPKCDLVKVLINNKKSVISTLYLYYSMLYDKRNISKDDVS